MATKTDELTYLGNLTVVTCWCGIRSAIPSEMWTEIRRQIDAGHQSMEVFCPLGHSGRWGGTDKVRRLEEQLAFSRQRQTELVDDVARERRRAAAARGVATRVKRRAMHALCPVDGCHRSFANVARHIARQHPEYSPELEEPDAPPAKP